MLMARKSACQSSDYSAHLGTRLEYWMDQALVLVCLARRLLPEAPIYHTYLHKPHAHMRLAEG